MNLWEVWTYFDYLVLTKIANLPNYLPAFSHKVGFAWQLTEIAQSIIKKKKKSTRSFDSE